MLRTMKRALLLSALVAGCGSGGSGNDGGAPVQPTLTDIQQKIFTPSCTFSSCHNDSTHAGNLVLVAGRSHAALVGVAADNAAARAAGKKRVVAGQAAQSFLYQKLSGVGLTFCQDPRTSSPTTCNEGFPMPDSSGSLPAAYLSAVEQWIARGAAND